MRKRLLVRVLPATAMATLLAACAGTPEQTTVQLTRASSSVEMAEQGGAPEYAAGALARAKEKIVAANRALENGDDELAMNLAEEAELDAQLAAAQADRRKAQRSLQEVKQSLDTLRREISDETMTGTTVN